MIFRLSQKLGRKIKAGKLVDLPLDENSFADWSAQMFLLDRRQCILLCNTQSFFSTVMLGRGIPNVNEFIKSALSHLRELFQRYGYESVFRRRVAPASAEVRFAKALNRSVTGSMNRLIFDATFPTEYGEPSPFDLESRMNEDLLSALGDGRECSYGIPREVFDAMIASESTKRE